MNYRPDIDGLRTIAVLPVVLYHAGVSGFTGGFVGVDIFFVISGFLITTIIHGEIAEGRFSVIRFYERRARRILPALFAVILVSLVVGWFLLTPADYDHMGRSILSALLFVSNMWFWQNSGGYFDGATDYLPMLHTWSLAVEEQFYIFFPLLLMLLHRIGRRLVLPAIVVLVMGSLVLAIWATPRMSSASFYLLPTRIWELGFGALLAMGVLPDRLPRVLREGLAVLGLAGVLLPVFLYGPDTAFPGLAAIPPVLGATLLIWTGGTGPTLAARLLSLPVMVGIGLISYSLYLWHWPVMAFARNRLFALELDPAWQVATVLVSVLAGWLSWRLVEKPFRISPRNGGFGQSAIFSMSLAGMLCLGLLAGATVLTRGAAEQRFEPAELIALDTTGFDPRVSNCRREGDIDRFCTFGTSGTPKEGDWILWGDSHAEALLPALETVAERQGRRLVLAGRPACAPLPGVTRSDRTQAQNRECTAFKARIEDLILTSGRFDTVVLHARWPLYIEGTRYGENDTEIIRLVSQTPPEIVGDDPAQNLLIAEDALSALVDRLTAAGLRVVIVGPVPELPWNMSDRMKQRVLYGTDLPEGPDRALVETRQARSIAMLERVAAARQVLFAEITPTLCRGRCPISDGLVSYYRDANHLSETGSRLLLPDILFGALASLPENPVIQ
ncbi:acyltransferase family protein [uncultured Mameliella sp.]|uniref:acyltransferase family protein n=2 Tax=uncultured Mameliella sp. TaxID=1447087 RepID=UPI0026023456|nr:acyltransferase family protein [uncultured Mameliella sp.]